jgi:levoglucosan dehydrogenase
MKTVKVAMIGAGFMGKAHAAAYATMPMFFWPPPAMPIRKVLVEITDALAEDARCRFGFEECATDWRKTVARADIDLVDIVTPNDSHAEIAIAAAQAGKHVICEKPLARNGDEARSMLDAVERAGVIHMIAFNYRRTPAVALARRYLEQGRIGQVLEFRVSYLQDQSADPEAPRTWRHQKAIAGSGTLGDIGTHAIDLARYLVGEIVAVNSLVKTHIRSRPLQKGSAACGEVDVDDAIVALVKFANGTIGSLEATRNALGRKNFLSFELHGSKGSLIFNYERRDELQVMFTDDPIDARGFRTVYTGPPHPYGENLWPTAALGIGFTDTKAIECFDLMSAIADRQEPSPSFRDGYQIALITDAILRSGETGDWQAVPPLRAIA